VAGKSENVFSAEGKKVSAAVAGLTTEGRVTAID